MAKKLRKFAGTNRLRNAARKKTVARLSADMFHVCGEDEYFVTFKSLDNAECLHKTGEFKGKIHQENKLCSHKLAVHFFLYGDKALEHHKRGSR